jgi:hypothetical protein
MVRTPRGGHDGDDKGADNNGEDESSSSEDELLPERSRDYFSQVLHSLASQADPKHVLSLMLSRDAQPAFRTLVQEVEVRVTQSLNLPPAAVDTNWSQRLQSIRREHDQSVAMAKLYEVTSDFNEMARMYGKCIISERHLPPSHKSLKPANLGGVAGGTKYVVCNIVFKFAQDVQLSSGEWLYGGAQEDDVAAHKAAGHERKGLHSILQCAVDGISAPLMTLVDFRGYRLSAQSVITIGPDTLIYGSCNAGLTICAPKHPMQLVMIERLGRELNLAQHRVADAEGCVHTLALPADMEVHASPADPSALYCLDVARLMPPMLAEPDRPRDVFSKLFRAEFLRRYPFALSPDAFSGFGIIDGELHSAAVKEATRFLHEELIPKVARKLTAKDALHVTRYLQQCGVNARFFSLPFCLGSFLQHSESRARTFTTGSLARLGIAVATLGCELCCCTRWWRGCARRS